MILPRKSNVRNREPSTASTRRCSQYLPSGDSDHARRVSLLVFLPAKVRCGCFEILRGAQEIANSGGDQNLLVLGSSPGYSSRARTVPSLSSMGEAHWKSRNPKHRRGERGAPPQTRHRQPDIEAPKSAAAMPPAIAIGRSFSLNGDLWFAYRLISKRPGWITVRKQLL